MDSRIVDKRTGFGHFYGNAKAGMNPHGELSGYFDKMLSGISGMKALLLDWETVTIASLATSQTSILNKEVFITLPITHDGTREPMFHIKAVIFCRPTYHNVQAIRKELRKPCFGEYHIFFTNILRDDLLRFLAETDENELIKQVQEFYGDYYPVSNKVFSLNIRDSLMLSVPQSRWGKMETGSFARVVEGIISVLLALKKNPVIRYSSSSPMCCQLSEQIRMLIERESQLFHFPEDKNSLLLILDRRDDPVTPFANPVDIPSHGP